MLVAAQSDTEGGGSFWTYDPATGAKQCFINPIDNRQLLRAVATRDGVAFLGGGLPTLDGPGTIVAFDPAQGRELWRIETGAEVRHRVPRRARSPPLRHRAQGRVLRGGPEDPARSSTPPRLNSRSVPQWSASLVNRGRVYAVSDTTLMTFDPETFAMTVVAPGLNGGWYSGCHLNTDEQGRIYTLRDRHLVQIDDRR